MPVHWDLGTSAGYWAWFLASLSVFGWIALRYAVMGLTSQFFGPSVCRGFGSRRSVALTFDDGPSPGTTELVDYLESQGVSATFFVCGANVLRHPAVVQDLERRGHEIGNHTFSHPRLPPRFGRKLKLISKEEIYRELASTQQAIASNGCASPTLFRAPYGMRWFGLRRAQQRLNLLGVMWTGIAHDWEWQAERVVAHLLARAAPGGILCLHDGRDIRSDPDISVTIEAVKLLVPRLRELGFEFEVVSKLLDRGVVR